MDYSEFSLCPLLNTAHSLPDPPLGNMASWGTLDNLLDKVLDSGLLPHAAIRIGIRQQLAAKLAEIHDDSLAAHLERKMAFVEEVRRSPIAIETAMANSQHYEVGTGVLEAMLGPRMKYSSCLYKTGGETLEQAEKDMLELYVQRAQLEDGMRILDLG